MEPAQKRQKTERDGRGHPRGGRGRGRGGRGGRDGERNHEPRQPREVKPPDWWKALCPQSILDLPLPEGTLPSESDFGVIAYLDPHRKPFQAVFKQRFSDFIVRELDQNGDVVTLKDMVTLPERDQLEIEERSKHYPQDEGLPEFIELMGQEITTKLYEFSKDEQKRGENFLVDISDVDKQKRTDFHKLIRKYFPTLRSETDVSGTSRSIKVFFPTKKRDRLQNAWPKDKPSFCQFVLYKENTDTTVALETIGKAMGCRSKVFNFAGTKDKRAITTQKVTAYKVTAQRLASINAKFPHIKTGDFVYVKHPLKLGDLKGNHFTITLKSVEAEPELLTTALNKIREHGFINFFGSQRFGTGTISTHHVGKALLQSKWAEAIDLLLKPRPFESEQVTRARMIYDTTGDIDKTMEIMPRFLVIERTLLLAMKKEGKNLNAITAIPSPMRLLYLHAYQSWVWNLLASRRVEMGLLPLVGDIAKKGDEYVYVTESNLHEFTLHDLVLPLPGHTVLYPKNEIYPYLKEIMARDNLDPHNMTRVQNLYSLPGGYRKIVEKCISFEYKIHQYEDFTSQLALSDLQKLESKEVVPSTGPYTAVVLEMKLESGSYATMLIRELTKTSADQITQKSIQEKLEADGSLKVLDEVVEVDTEVAEALTEQLNENELENLETD